MSGTAPRLEHTVGLLLRCLVSQHLPRALPPPLPAAVWGGPRDGPDPRKGSQALEPQETTWVLMEREQLYTLYTHAQCSTHVHASHMLYMHPRCSTCVLLHSQHVSTRSIHIHIFYIHPPTCHAHAPHCLSRTPTVVGQRRKLRLAALAGCVTDQKFRLL